MTAGESLRLPEALPGLLLDWYDASARVLPWRSEPTPYRVWVSEIMLQQTRVEAAKPYFLRFVEALPDIPALAACPEEALLKLWEGLGYYSRVRNLQKAARLVVERYGGELPASFEALRSLPGIGDYTAGAIASIAFGLARPAVDGNVLRVVSRLTASRRDIADPALKPAVGAEIAAILPARPGDFNQALMELGACICLPNGEPLCGGCPLGGICRARELGIQGSLPVKAPKKPRRQEERTIVIIRREDTGELALRRRPAAGLLAGMWEPVSFAGRLDQWQTLDALFPLGVTARSLAALPPARHIFTHIEWRMTGWLALVPDGAVCPEAGVVWVHPEELVRRFSLPSAFRPFFEAAGVGAGVA